jgi:hypothetical protein
MRKLIEHLRGRPESHRHAVALGVSFFITLVIAGIWATTTFPLGGSNSAVVAKNGAAKTAPASGPQGPVTTFGRNVAQSFTALKTQLSALGSYFSETSYESQPTLEVVNSAGSTGNLDNSVINY